MEGKYKINMNNNVITEEEYRERINLLFEDVSNTLSKTLGPYGATSVLDKVGDVMLSKDGWQVLKKLAYMDEVQNTLLGLIVKIAHQVVMRVGDGSTTSVVGANQLLKQIDEIAKKTNLRPKQLLDTLEEVVEDICDMIQEIAVPINKDGDLDEIYQLALVSTNGDSSIAEMIRTIYKETGNPAIEFNKSKSTYTTYEVLKGYKLQFMTYIDRIFINNDNGTCHINKPIILMFNHKLEQDYFEPMIQPAIREAINRGQRLVVVAPYYDSFLLQRFARDIALEFKATKSSVAVYAKGSLMDEHRADLYNDFAALCGCTIINESIALDVLKGDMQFNVLDYLGEVEEMDIGEQSTFATGFHKKDEAMIDILEKDAISKYQEFHQAAEKSSTITEALVNAKQRMSKLKGNMGIINVGGSTELAKLANFDLVEDAVKACESAYLFGVTPGQTIGIQTAIVKLRDSKKYKNNKIGQLYLDAISDAYRDVTRILLENKFKENIPHYVMNKLLKESIKEQAVIDIEKTEIEFIEVVGADNISLEDGNLLQRFFHKFEKIFKTPDLDDVFKPEAVVRELELNNTIINSCKTDIEVLRATAGIVGLLLSSNQYVAVRF
jgi:chaperonin GroEL (HSP60 family)